MRRSSAHLLGHILDRQQHGHGVLPPRRLDAARVEKHVFAPDLGELMLHRKLLELRVLGAQGLEQRPQRRNIPLAVAELVEDLSCMESH